MILIMQSSSQVYFSPEWASLLETSFRNFLAGVMRCLPLPAVLRFNTDRRLRLALQQQVHHFIASYLTCKRICYVAML